jgi:hypothetical protein
MHLHDFANFRVLDRAQLRSGDPAMLMIVTRLQNFARAKQAADVIGAKWRDGASHLSEHSAMPRACKHRCPREAPPKFQLAVRRRGGSE